MNRHYFFSFFLFFVFVVPGTFLLCQTKHSQSNEINSKLAVLWTSGDRDVALKMVFMYTLNAKKQGWWQDIQFIIWGPSAKLTSEDIEIQDYLKKMKDSGIELVACKACAESYGVSEPLKKFGIDVKYMGVSLTELLKSEEWKVVTF